MNLLNFLKGQDNNISTAITFSLSGTSLSQTEQTPTPFIRAVSGSFVLDACDVVNHLIARVMYRKMRSTEVGCQRRCN